MKIELIQTMNNETIRGEYQAPEIEVRIIKIRTGLLQGSPNQIGDVDVDEDEFGF